MMMGGTSATTRTAQDRGVDEMNNVEKLKELGILEDVRGRLGAEENDTSEDNAINNADARQLVRWYCGWQLGSEGWADIFIETYQKLSE